LIAVDAIVTTAAVLADVLRAADAGVATAAPALEGRVIAVLVAVVAPDLREPSTDTPIEEPALAGLLAWCAAVPAAAAAGPVTALVEAERAGASSSGPVRS